MVAKAKLLLLQGGIPQVFFGEGALYGISLLCSILSVCIQQLCNVTADKEQTAVTSILCVPMISGDCFVILEGCCVFLLGKRVWMRAHLNYSAITFQLAGACVITTCCCDF